jgi:hypothetical protein
MSKRSVGSLVALFVLLGLFVCADGLFADINSRASLFQCALLALTSLYMGAVLLNGHFPDDAVDVWLLILFALAPIVATTTMLLQPFGWPFSWTPFVVLPLLSVVVWVELKTRWSEEKSRLDRLQSAVLAIWVTAGGIYIAGLLLRLPYIKFFHAHALSRSILDLRALVVVSLIVPTAIRAAITVRVNESIRSNEERPATPPTKQWARIIAGFVLPLRRLGYLIYRILHYIAVVLLAWSEAFAVQLRTLITDLELYKSSGQVLLVYFAYELITLPSAVIAAALTEYLRVEPPWAGGATLALWSGTEVVVAVLLLLLVALLVRAALAQYLDEADIIVAAELLGWAIVSSVCASVVLWLAQHFGPLGMVGFTSPGVITAAVGMAILVYLVKLSRSSDKMTQTDL